MHDFKAGHDINVGGDVYIHDESSQPKLLVQCTNEELYEERKYRKALLSGERKRKYKCILILWLCAEALVAGVALWYYVHGNTNLSSLIIGLGSFLMAMPFTQAFQSTPIEQRQTDALQEIAMILHERGAR